MENSYTTDTVELKKMMVEKGISTIGQLSTMTKINRNTLSQILSGMIQPSAEAMRKLVFALEIPPEKAGMIFFKLNLRSA